MSVNETVKLDSKGRLTVPRHVRDAAGLAAGDTLFLDFDDGVLTFAKAENPFDALAEEAIAEHRAGQSRPLREVAAAHGIPFDE